MSIRCDTFKNAAMELGYGELDDALAESLRAHAAECPDCAATIQDLLLTRKMAATLEPPPTPSSIDASILEAAREYCNSVSSLSEAPTPTLHRQPPRSAFDDFLQTVRALLLKPAFATAMAAGVVVLISVFLIDSTPKSKKAETSIKSVMEERPLEVVNSAQPTPQAAAPEPPPPISPALSKERPKADGQDIEEAEELKPSRMSSRKQSVTLARSRRSHRRDSAKNDAPKTARATEARDLDLKGGRSVVEAPSRSVPSSQASEGSGIFSPPPPPRKKAAKQAEAPAPFGEIKSEVESTGPSLGSAARFDDLPESEAEDEMVSDHRSESAAPPVSNEYQRGMRAYNRGNCIEAVSALKASLSIPSASPGKRASAIHHIARCEKRQGRCSAALTYYDKLISSYPQYPARPNALLEAAQCRRRLGQLQKARALLKTLEQIPGWSEEARRRLDNLGDSP